VNHTISATQAAKMGFTAGTIISGAGAWVDNELGISSKIDYAWNKAKQIFEGE
jgi:hypothetical protein